MPNDPSIRAAMDRWEEALSAHEAAFMAMLAALASYGVKRDLAETGGRSVGCGSPAALRVLAAIAGIPEDNPPDGRGGPSVTLLNLIQLRLGMWIARTAMDRMNRALPHRREPRSLPPLIAAYSRRDVGLD